MWAQILHYVLAAAVVLFLVPVLVYLCVKLGTYAFYRGRQLFLDQDEKGKNGKGVR